MQLSRENRNMNTEHARIMYLPDSRLYAWLDQFYVDEIEWRANGNPHDLTPAAIVAELESDQVDPLEHDWNGLEDSDLSPLWSDLGYPLPTDADEMADAWYGTSPSDIARAALREYANLFDVETVAARVIESLRADYDSQNSNNN